MRVAVVINAASGALVGRPEAAAEVAAHLEAAGLDAAIEPDDGRTLVERIRAAACSGAEAVVVGGGDGTIACAAQELVGTGIAFGILPLGTMNLLAKDLKIPLDLGAAADALAHGVIRDIDVGDVNGKLFLCASLLGMPSRMARHRERVRGTFSLGEGWRFLVAAIRGLRSVPPLTVAIDLGDGFRRVRTRAIAVVDNDYDEAFGALFSRSDLDRGELAVYIARNLSPVGAVRLWIAMALGRWRTRPELERHLVRRFVIQARRKHLRVMNDGEVVLLKPPLRYRIRPKAMRIIVPAVAAGAADPLSPADRAPIEDKDAA